MEILEIFGDNRHESYTKTRQACRGIVMDGEQILMSYEVNTDQWFIPGGGVEPGESLKDCCVRELAEETGVLVEPWEHFLTVREYYEEWLYESYYFVCKITGQARQELTRAEMENGLEPRWIPLAQALDIFSKHQDYAATNEMTRGSYLREYEALQQFLRI